jgi:hypothetical protein
VGERAVSMVGLVEGKQLSPPHARSLRQAGPCQDPGISREGLEILQRREHLPHHQVETVKGASTGAWDTCVMGSASRRALKVACLRACTPERASVWEPTGSVCPEQEWEGGVRFEAWPSFQLIPPALNNGTAARPSGTPVHLAERVRPAAVRAPPQSARVHVRWCEEKATPDCRAKAMVHELAHSCGWSHGQGLGVPGDDGFLRCD